MVSNQYWEKRSKSWSDNKIKDDEEFARLLSQKYNSLELEINREINEFYVRYAKKEGLTLDQARKKVSEFDVKSFQNQAKQMVKDKDFSDYANERLRLYNATLRINRLEALKARIGLDIIKTNSEIEELLKQHLSEDLYKEAKENAGILGVDITKSQSLKINTLLNGSYQNTTFSERLWMNNDALKAELDKMLSRGMIQGERWDKSISKIKKQLNSSVKNANYAADRLARTESARMASEYKIDLIKSQGYKNVKWLCERGACSICKPYDNKIFKIKEVPDLPVHPNCRCHFIGITID
ncbi:minor capsid protein [Lactobacillus terrae]|uniref:minor capsid protein n=1 Tax=Lactobacillus terrae TaxID=2269374 RepID=UPI000C1B77B6|nr:minor capsid protein [Lactobacillus terrae]